METELMRQGEMKGMSGFHEWQKDAVPWGSTKGENVLSLLWRSEKRMFHTMQRRKVTAASSQIQPRVSSFRRERNIAALWLNTNVGTANWMRCFCFCLRGGAKFSKITLLNCTQKKKRWNFPIIYESATFQIKGLFISLLQVGRAAIIKLQKRLFQCSGKQKFSSVQAALRDCTMWLLPESVAYRKDE